MNQEFDKAFSDSLNDFNFSLETIKFGPFSIGDNQFELREASEAAHVAYRNATMRAMQFSGSDDKNRTASMNGGAEADTILIAMCLFKLIPNGSNPQTGVSNPPVVQPCTIEYVKTLPRRITSRLYNKLRSMSGMDEEQETVEFLTKRIAYDQAKIVKLSKEGTPGKDEQSST